ncbi:MAG TPA: hypothetical protein VMT00_04840 [Thermoanaerobaculia bacterium]|nr:hypothetical protein [Thermoanaerobaculia bacterium]
MNRPLDRNHFEALALSNTMSRDAPTFPPFAILLVLGGLTVSLSAAVVDRHLLAGPRSELISVGPARVVASDGGMFLVHGQRITTAGINLDEGEPIRGADGYAVGWSDGWMIIRSSFHEEISILHLDEDGVLEPYLDLPRAGDLLGAASRAGRIAMVERVYEQQGSTIWITVAGDEGMVRRSRLGRLDEGVIKPLGDGFLVVTTIRASSDAHLLHAWSLDADGRPLHLEEIGQTGYVLNLAVATNGHHAILATTGLFEATVRVIGPTLEATTPIIIPAPPGTDLTRLFPLPMDEQFLVSYGMRTGGVTEERAMIVNNEGTVVSDGSADPIAAGDRSGQHYLVMRPWGDAGLAEDDPRRIVTALQMKGRLYQPAHSIRTVVSGDVTLASFRYSQSYFYQQPGGRAFVRFDGDGTPIDHEPQSFPGEIVFAMPEGFAFLSMEGGVIRMRRLGLRDGLIAEPVTLAEAPGARALAADATAHDFLVVWATRDEIVWSRFNLEGMPLQATPSRRSRGKTRTNSVMDISRHGGVRLLLVYDTDPCWLSPCVESDLYESLALDQDGEPIGPLHQLDVRPDVRAAGLPDGTWAVPVSRSREGSVMHLARDGAFLGVVSHPMLSNLTDLAPTPLGWKAIAEDPLRLVEVNGLDAPVRLTGLHDMSSPTFGFGRWLAFLDAAGFEPTPVPWNGRIETLQGDLSIRLRDVGRDALERRIRIEVTNEGATVASDISVTASDFLVYFGPFRRSTGTIASLEPGQTAFISAAVRSTRPDLSFLVVSSGIEDGDVEDNRALLSSATPVSRRRAVGRD